MSLTNSCISKSFCCFDTLDCRTCGSLKCTFASRQIPSMLRGSQRTSITQQARKFRDLGMQISLKRNPYLELLKIYQNQVVTWSDLKSTRLIEFLLSDAHYFSRKLEHGISSWPVRRILQKLKSIFWLSVKVFCYKVTK